tara:strand:+ start:1892 stop:2737 length:846 start_codon:yes stop_codon:yes gene_type:complete
LKNKNKLEKKYHIRNLYNMKILLTGSYGFIGKNIKNELLPKHNLIYLEKDFIDNQDWENLLEENVKLVDTILHIGAISDTTLQDPNEMLKYNYWFSKKLFDCAKKYDKKVIYASSAATTGVSGTPTSIYAWSKLMAEQYGLALGGQFIALRYFNVYGPGEEHKGKMASVAYQAYKQGTFKLFPKNPKRDFIYIKDVVSATLYPLINEIPSGVYEVGSGKARSFKDMLDYLEILHEYRNEEDIPDGYQYYTKSDSKKWMPGWKPEYNIEQGIKEYKKYLKNN